MNTHGWHRNKWGYSQLRWLKCLNSNVNQSSIIRSIQMTLLIAGHTPAFSCSQGRGIFFDMQKDGQSPLNFQKSSFKHSTYCVLGLYKHCASNIEQIRIFRSSSTIININTAYWLRGLEVFFGIDRTSSGELNCIWKVKTKNKNRHITNYFFKP